MQLFNSTKGGLLVVNSVMGSFEFLQNPNIKPHLKGNYAN